jgi:transcription antitermination factor NusG
MEKWYVAHSKPRNEELLWRQFCLRRIDSYYPRIEVQPVNPRTRKVQPYFPGYLFVHVDLERVGRSSIEWMPGAAGLVAFGDEPASVSDGLIASIKQRIESLRVVSDEGPVPFCKGDNIVVHEGIFNGYEGIFDVQLSGTDRVRIFLSLLDRRKIPVELSASCVRLVD